MKDNKEKGLKIAIVMMLIVCIILVICFQIQKYRMNHVKYANIVIENGIVHSDADYDQLEKDNMRAKLVNMKERDRMEYYVSHFITNCEKGRYDLAYETLGTEFKNNYFATEIEFENYAKSKFPSMADVSFTNIERNNNVYVLWVTITDAINGTKDSGIEYNFVVEEKDINDIQLAFSVK